MTCLYGIWDGYQRLRVETFNGLKANVRNPTLIPCWREYLQGLFPGGYLSFQN